MSPERKEKEGKKFDFHKEFRRSIDHIAIDLQRAGKKELDIATFEDRREYVTQRGIILMKIGNLPPIIITPQTATAALTIYDLINNPGKFLDKKGKEKPKNSQELKYAAFRDVYGKVEKQKAFIKVIQRAEKLAKKLPDKEANQK